MANKSAYAAIDELENSITSSVDRLKRLMHSKNTMTAEALRHTVKDSCKTRMDERYVIYYITQACAKQMFGRCVVRLYYYTLHRYDR